MFEEEDRKIGSENILSQFTELRIQKPESKISEYVGDDIKKFLQRKLTEIKD